MLLCTWHTLHPACCCVIASISCSREVLRSLLSSLASQATVPIAGLESDDEE